MHIHQALHGYSDGHRLLATSRLLDPRDTKTMLVLSDSGSTSGSIPMEGYLTGYPLTASKAYALARTWPAPEMSRPGCVWTHTLLIDFGDLASLQDCSQLLGIFRRPNGIDLDSYLISRTSDYPPSPIGNAFSPLLARGIVGALYMHAETPIVASPDIDTDRDALLLAIWSQQWPRLRRNFRFCGHSASDRSSDFVKFDLQLLANRDRSIRSRFPLSIDAEHIIEFDDWVPAATRDLLLPNCEKLRDFLKLAGGDAEAGRSIFGILCTLHQLVNSEPSGSERYAPILDKLVHRLKSSQATSAQIVLISAVLSSTGEMSLSTARFIEANSFAIDPSLLRRYGAKFLKRVFDQHPSVFIESFLSSQTWLASTLEMIDSFSDDEAIYALVEHHEMASQIIRRRPTLLSNPAIWARTKDDIFEIIGDRTLKRSEVLAAVESGRRDLAHLVLENAGTAIFLETISISLRRSSFTHEYWREWLSASMRYPDEVSQFLCTSPGASWRFLVYLASTMQPGKLKPILDKDPWLFAVQKSMHIQNEPVPDYLSAFALARAFSGYLSSSSQLISLVFENVFIATQRDLLSNDLWEMVDRELPWTYTSKWTSKSLRLCEAVGITFRDRNLSHESFITVCRTDQIFELVVKPLAKSMGGRKYLKSSISWIAKNGPRKFSTRRKIIEHALE